MKVGGIDLIIGLCYKYSIRTHHLSNDHIGAIKLLINHVFYRTQMTCNVLKF